MRALHRFMKLTVTAFLLAMAVVPLVSRFALAAEKSKITNLVLHPSTEPRPALKYTLLPDVLEQSPRNAAADYNRLIIRWQSDDHKKPDMVFYDWLDMPLDELPRAEVHRALARHQSFFNGLHTAVRCDHCDWQISIRENNDLQMQMPELKIMREFARLLMVKARLEIAEGKHEQAIETLQTGYAMAQHIAHSPSLVNHLVGMAIFGLMGHVVEELIAQPDSPNMYWALTTLPSPIIRTNKAIAVDLNLIYLMLPEFRNIDKTPNTHEYWHQFSERICENNSIFIHVSPKPSIPKNRMAVMAMVGKYYPNCKRALIAAGLSEQEVEDMPVAKVVAMQFVVDYNEIRDDMNKWCALPYWQAKPGLDAIERRLRSSKQQHVSFPFADIIFQTTRATKVAEARTEQLIAILRTIEAIRLFAAARDGRLPGKLKEITSVPLPINPMTGKPCEYQLKADTGIIKTRLWRDEIIEIKIAK